MCNGTFTHAQTRTGHVASTQVQRGLSPPPGWWFVCRKPAGLSPLPCHTAEAWGVEWRLVEGTPREASRAPNSTGRPGQPSGSQGGLQPRRGQWTGIPVGTVPWARRQMCRADPALGHWVAAASVGPSLWVSPRAAQPPPHPPPPTLPPASRGGKMWRATIQGLVGAHLWGRRLPGPRGLPAEGGAGGSRGSGG